MKPLTKRAPSTQQPYQSALAHYSAARFVDALAALDPILRQAHAAPAEQHASALNLAAACSLSLGRADEAQSWWRLAVTAKPSYAEAWNNLAVVYRQKQQYRDAEDAVRQAIAVRPDYAEAHNTLASLLSDQKRFEEAEAACRHALALAPQHADAQHNLAVVLLGLKRPAEAEAALRTTLALRPQHAESWQQLGSVLHELGRDDEAEAAWNQALAIRPNFQQAHFCLSVHLQRRGRIAEADAACRRALDIDPNYYDAWQHLGTLHQAQGRPYDAIASYRRAASIRPNDVEAAYNLAVMLQNQRQLDDAEAAYRRALELAPEHTASLNNLASLLIELERQEEAVEHLKRAIAIEPDFAEAFSNLGAALKALDRLDEAADAAREAVRLRPSYTEAHNNLGIILQDKKDLDEAERAYRAALALDPNYASGYHNLGTLLKDMKRYEEAVVAHRRALEIEPNFPQALNNLGVALQDLGRADEAVDAFEQTLKLSADYTPAYNNYGVALKELDRIDEAEGAFRHALSRKPDFADASFNLSTLLLSRGELAEGFAHYEARTDESMGERCSFEPKVETPKWHGEPLAGKRLLVWFEQGHGDMLQFGRFFGQLKDLGAAHITFSCAPALMRTFLGVRGIDTLVNADAPLDTSKFDYWTFLMSVPHHLGTTLDTLPDAVYLRPDAALVEYWRPRVEALPGRKIGLVWKGNPNHRNDRNRSLPSLATLAPLWNAQDVSFVSLQKGAGEDEASAPGDAQPLLHLGTDIRDFADSAAVMSLLDLVICVDTATAHLAGSFGVPCWVMLPKFGLDWRWMRDRTDSPWYRDTARLFRQQVSGDWSTVVDTMRDELAQPLPMHRRVTAAAIVPAVPRQPQIGIEAARELLATAHAHYAAARHADALDALQPLLAAPAALFDTAFAINVTNLAGAVCLNLNRADEAETHWLRVIGLAPDHVFALNNLGALYKSLGRADDAIAMYKHALALKPDYVEAQTNLGSLLHDLGRWDEAQAAFRAALDLNPDHADAHYNLAVSQYEAGKLLEADASYRQAIAIQPGFVRALNNLAVLLTEMNRPREAEVVCRQAIAADATFASAQNTLALALAAMGRSQEAEFHYLAALALDPNYADAGFNYSSLLLAEGRYDEAWPLYENRSKRARASHNSKAPRVECPQWRGEPVAGKRLLIWFEQGYGDMIQFGRYLVHLKAAGAHVTLACAPALMRLFLHAPGIDALVSAETAVQSQQFDYWTFLMSLPLYFGTTLDSIPAARWLAADPAMVEFWKPRLASLQGRKVGLIWKGSPAHSNDASRSLPSLKVLAPLWNLPGVSFVSLQKGAGEDEARAPGDAQPLLHLGSDIRDFADSAAIVSQLDLVICVDTAIAHLAGSLGVPCFVLLPHAGTDWRWLSQRADSPWYPDTAWLFRQKRQGGWSAAVHDVAEACAAVFADASQTSAQQNAADSATNAIQH